MELKQKFLLGRGESLNTPSEFRGAFDDSEPQYSWGEQLHHLMPMMTAQQKTFDDLPQMACPNDVVVSAMTLHPRYYSKSSFPKELLRQNGMRFLGSKPACVKPRSGRGAEKGASSTVVFVAGQRRAFARLYSSLSQFSSDDPVVNDLLKLESIAAFTAADRLMGSLPRSRTLLEIVLHHDDVEDYQWERQFEDYAKSSGIELDIGRNYQSRGLWFMPALGSSGAAEKLANFSFVRAIRPMPKLRPLKKPRVVRSSGDFAVELPNKDALDSSFRVAVFDGGLPSDHPFGRWASVIEPTSEDGIGAAIPEFVQHGMAVTSAVLFGNVQRGKQQRPYCQVDHFRVLGEDTNDTALYPVMLYIDQLLNQSNYEFATLSIGPVEVVGDDQVTAWTAMLDDHFQQGQMLGTIAVGNDGEQPHPRNRIQVPSDCVNGIAVGAADDEGARWARASYSCIGPGRVPGAVKPDLMQFGGTTANPFRFVFPESAIYSAAGTSFATPVVMRVAAGVRAHFGSEISTLGIKALMIHGADQNGHDRSEVGWGMVPTDLAKLTVCEDGSVRVLYQGQLDPAKVIRALIPLPSSGLIGEVTIRATFCFVCPTDPQSPGDYTRSGLGITFRPHKDKFAKPARGKKIDPNFPKARPFFEGVGRRTEQLQRADGFKWDTTRHAVDCMRASSLHRPVFDIHCMARAPGERGTPRGATKIPYALVVTVSAPKVSKLYELVLEQYPKLSAITPRANLPIPVRTT